VGVSIIVQNVSYLALADDGDLLSSFQAAVKAQVANFSSVFVDNVTLHLSPSPVPIVGVSGGAIVMLESGHAADLVTHKLLYGSIVGQLSRNLTDVLGALSGIDAALRGDMSVSVHIASSELWWMRTRSQTPCNFSAAGGAAVHNDDDDADDTSGSSDGGMNGSAAIVGYAAVADSSDVGTGHESAGSARIEAGTDARNQATGGLNETVRIIRYADVADVTAVGPGNKSAGSAITEATGGTNETSAIFGYDDAVDGRAVGPGNESTGPAVGPGNESAGSGRTQATVTILIENVTFRLLNESQVSVVKILVARNVITALGINDTDPLNVVTNIRVTSVGAIEAKVVVSLPISSLPPAIDKFVASEPGHAVSRLIANDIKAMYGVQAATKGRIWVSWKSFAMSASD